MQIKDENFAFLANLVNQAKKILILVGETNSVDNLAAGLAFEAVLSALGKSSQVYFRGEAPEVLKDLSAKITNKVEPKKLVVSFNWRKNEIEKVSYNLEGDNFNFIVSPKSKQIDSVDLKISYQGEEADLIISLGASSLAEMTELDRGFFENKTIINIDKNPRNQLFGRLNFVDPGAESICAIVAKIFAGSSIPAQPEAGDILLLGLRLATDNFSKLANPATFEAAAFCTKMKEGKVKTQELKESPGFAKSELSNRPQTKQEVPEEWLSPKILRSKQVS